MIRFGAVLVITLAALSSGAHANEICVDQLDKLVNDWKAIAVPGPHSQDTTRPADSEHEHNARDVWYMRSQLRLALRLCNENKDHEAMLRMDVVRAWLKLPEVKHPIDHRYTFEK